MVELELEDIQALILTGHGKLPFSMVLLLEIENRAGAKAWLGSIVAQVTTARRREKGERPDVALQVAFTRQGLEKLGLPEETIKSFSVPFQMGMADAIRSHLLGDTGPSAPANWEWGGPGRQGHVLVILYAKNQAKLEDLVKRHREAIAASGGVKEVLAEYSPPREGDKEPFGFRDSIAQPIVEGGFRAKMQERPKHPKLPKILSPDFWGTFLRLPFREPMIKAGEFILGYPNQYKKLPFSPVVPASMDSQGLLRPAAGGENLRDLGRNGTYLVFRKLSQDVDGFWKYLNDSAQRPDGTPDPQRAIWLGAKMVGRWPSGAPLVTSPHHDTQILGSTAVLNNWFLYDVTDKHGFACPIGSHIRRSNPRDSGTPSRKLSMTASSRHRIIRRGLPYLKKDPESGKILDQGIFFIALNTDIARQFEFIQQTWINNQKFGGLYNDKDPITGDPDGKSTFVIPAHPVRERVHGFQRFVTVKAGAYFFLPGIKALKFLAADWPQPPPATNRPA